MRTASLVGPEVFELVTSAMYNEPLAMYREYIQNSADSLLAGNASTDLGIAIAIDPVARKVIIRDNGPGLSHEQACRALLPIGKSQKRRGRDVGFRGVGRLAGLAFAETVSFATRATRDSSVTVVEWHAAEVRKRVRETGQVDQAIRDCVAVKKVDGNSEPEHFFEVEIAGIHRFAAETILNSDAVRNYISEIGPVAIGRGFPFWSNLQQLFQEVGTPTALEISISGDESPILRPFAEDIRMSATRRDRYTELEAIRIPAVDRRAGVAAIGWVAHSGYLGAIPKSAGIRGIRARVGNIQIGDEAVFDHLFSQARFNRWCVGEVHILDRNVVPNGRRDYFEAGPHTRNLENHLTAVCRRIVTRCRRASRERNAERRLVAKMTELEASHTLASSGYLRPDEATRLLEQATIELLAIRKASDRMTDAQRLEERIDRVADLLDGTHARRSVEALEDLPAVQAAAYQDVFGAVAAVAKTGSEALTMIETIVDRITGPQCSRSGGGGEAGSPVVSRRGASRSVTSSHASGIGASEAPTVGER